MTGVQCSNNILEYNLVKRNCYNIPIWIIRDDISCSGNMENGRRQMGKNYFKAIPINSYYDAKLINFSYSLGKAIGKGETIPFADNDVTYA